MKSYIDYCKDMIKSKLKRSKGERIVLTDFPYLVMEIPKVNKTLTFYPAIASRYLEHWKTDIEAYREHLNNSMDIRLYPEPFHVYIVDYGVRRVWDRIVLNLEIEEDASYSIDSDVVLGVSIELENILEID